MTLYGYEGRDYYPHLKRRLQTRLDGFETMRLTSKNEDEVFLIDYEGPLSDIEEFGLPLPGSYISWEEVENLDEFYKENEAFCLRKNPDGSYRKIYLDIMLEAKMLQ
ncbi:hypothetical protein DMB44_04245 [Thermoplasma sp. Kam2015]|uniref:hypothetical protein n=1 Tax=Thermoplasma sp. Kam2015 TaxID=2094122 RepID=UPI000D8F9BEC|nr:hypothetical protein [Thermoplasma sp. Kam2015]PYB68551.1 hypothetical protein DMB44_04245 [Thermoplasma sp. Kam2015]